MSSFFVLWKREMRSFFYTSVAGVVGTFFLIVTGFSFWVLANVLTQGAPGVDVTRSLFASQWYWAAYFMVIPLTTMSLFAGERRSGTLELLMTAPVTECAVVLAKFFAAFALYLLFWLPTLSYAFILHTYSTDMPPMDYAAAAASYLGMALTGALGVAIGLCCSLMTRSVVIAAMMCAAALGIFFSVGHLSDFTYAAWVREAALYASMPIHMLDFSRGSVDTRTIVYYVSTTALLLFIGTKVLEGRRLK